MTPPPSNPPATPPGGTSDFPSPLMPPLLRHYSEELASTFDCPPEIPAALCLATAGAAIGNSARLQGLLGCDQIGPNLYLGLGITENYLAAQMLNRICQPLVSHQTKAFRDHANITPEALAKQVAEIEREKKRHFENDRFPDPIHVAYFDDQLQALKRKARPLIYLEDPSPAQLLAALHQSADAAILAVYQDSASTEHFMEAFQSSKLDLVELLRKAWRQQNVTGAYLIGGSDCPLLEPSLSMVCLCEPALLTRLVSNTGLVQGVAQQFLAFDCGIKPKTITAPAAGRNLAHQQPWNDHIGHLLECRCAQRRARYRFAAKASEILWEYHNELVENLENRRAEHSPGIECTMCQCTKLALIDHLLRACHVTEVGEKSALAAVALSRWFMGKRTQLLLRFDQERRQGAGEAACGVMLAKLQSKGKLKRWDLFRSYDCQQRDVHQPILDKLIADGRVVRLADDYVIAADKEMPAEHVEAADLATDSLNPLNKTLEIDMFAQATVQTTDLSPGADHDTLG